MGPEPEVEEQVLKGKKRRGVRESETKTHPWTDFCPTTCSTPDIYSLSMPFLSGLLNPDVLERGGDIRSRFLRVMPH